MSEAEGGWVLEITFPRPYGGIEKTVRNGGLVLMIPFGNEPSAEFARNEMQVTVHPRFRVIQGQAVKGEIQSNADLAVGDVRVDPVP